MESILLSAILRKAVEIRSKNPLIQRNKSKNSLHYYLRTVFILLTLIQLQALTKGYAQSCNTINFSNPVTLSPTSAANAWDPDRYAPSGFTAQAIAPDNRLGTLKHSISATDSETGRPGGYNSAFYNTQGRGYLLAPGAEFVQTDLFIGSGWSSTGRRMAGLWSIPYNVGGTSNESYPLIEYTSGETGARFRGWENDASQLGGNSWIDLGLPAGFVENSWVTLKIELLPSKQFRYTVKAANGNEVTATTTTYPNTAASIGRGILQGHNNSAGVTYDIFWDNFSPATIPAPVTNENTLETFCSIQAAIDDADTQAGHVIRVLAGTYNESVTISKAIKLYGAKAGIDPRPIANTTRITPGDESTISVAGTERAVFITSSNVEFDGFTVKHITTAGEEDLISSPDDAIIKNTLKIANNIIQSSTDEGIQLRYFSNATIVKNYVINSKGDGINMCKDPNGINHIIEHNEIKGSTERFGSIYLYGIKDVKVRHNLITGTGLGISVSSISAKPSEICSDIEISYNTLTNIATNGVYAYSTFFVGGDGTTNVNIHHNYGEEMAGTQNYMSMVRVVNNVTNVKVNNNFFKKIYNQKYITFGEGNGSLVPISPVDVTCNWYGTSNLNDIPSKIVNLGSNLYIPYLTSGTNTLAAGSLGFEPQPNVCSAPVFNVQKNKYYITLTAAITDADETNTLNIGAHTFTENVVVNKSLTLAGTSKATSILTGSTGYGIYISADNVTIKDLTVDQAPLQGLLTSCGVDNLTITNVAVTNSNKTGFNINGVTTATLTNLTATGNKGNGMSISDSKNITVNGYTSNGNAFASSGFGAGIGIFSNGACSAEVPGGTDIVKIEGVLAIGENVQIYQQGTAISNITLPSTFTYMAGVGSTDKFFYPTKVKAFAGIAGLSGGIATKYVQEIISGNMYVNADMSIQTAINTVSVTTPAKTVFVEAGSFSENVIVNKSIVLAGASISTTTLTGAADYGLYIDADDVTIQDLTIHNAPLQGLLTNCGKNNLTITNVAVTNSGKSGFNINGINTATLTNITATGNKGNGVSISDSKNITINGLTSSTNAFTPSGFGAGIGIFSNGACKNVVPAGTDNVDIKGALNISEAVHVYQQGETISNIILPATYTHLVGVGTTDKFYTTSKTNAYTGAIALGGDINGKHVQEISSGNMYVNNGMSIQTAINAAASTTPAKTVFVEPGNFTESVLVNKPLKIYGAKFGIDPRPSKNSSRVTPSEESTISVAGSQQAVSISNSNVEFDGFTVKHNTSVGEQDLISSTDVSSKSNLRIANNIIESSTDEGIQVRFFSNATVEKNYITNSKGDGINMCKNPTGTNHLVQDNEINGSGSSFGSIYMYGINDVKVKNNYIRGNGHGISVSSRSAVPAEICSNIEISYNTISNVVASSVYSFTGLLVGGTGTSNVNVHHNYIEELAGTASYPSMVRLLNDLTNIKINNNSFVKTANQRYITFGDNNALIVPTNSIDARCNWYGSNNISDVTARVFNPGSHVFSPYLTSGTNTLAAGLTGFEPEANSCSVPCDIAVTNTTTNTGSVISGTTINIPSGTLKFTSSAGYDTYKWSACSNGLEASCNVAAPSTTNTLTRDFAQIGFKGVKLEKTINGETQTCYFPFSVNPYISTSSPSTCSILLRKNGSGGTNKWFRNDSELLGVTSDNFTATENGIYILKVTVGADVFVSAPYEVNNLSGGISVTTQPLATQTICENEMAAALGITTTPTATSFNWYSNTANSNTGGTLITSANSSSFTPATNTVGTTYYYATGTSSTGCITKSAPSKVVVNAATGVAAAGATSLVTITSSSQNITANCGLVGTLTSPGIAASATPTVTISSELSVPAGIKKYTITPTAGEAFAADLVLYFTQADFDAFNASSVVDVATNDTDVQGIANLRILHKSNSIDATIDPTSIIWNSSQTRWEISFSITHFSTFELAAQATALPVKLASFKALKESNTTLLKWSTTSEANSAYFDVQHSVSGKNWVSIGKREALGESAGWVSYNFTHTAPVVGENLYRLKMVDNDGTFAYSSIESITLDAKEQITLYPNPVSDRLQIDSPQWNQVRSVKLIDVNGRSVFTATGVKLNNQIDVKTLTPGTYLVEITHQNGVVNTSKIVIIR